MSYVGDGDEVNIATLGLITSQNSSAVNAAAAPFESFVAGANGNDVRGTVPGGVRFDTSAGTASLKAGSRVRAGERPPDLDDLAPASYILRAVTDLRLLQGGGDSSEPDAVDIRLIGVSEGTLAEVHRMLVELSRSGRISGFEMERRAGPHDDTA